jgi:DNA polymerase
MQFSTASRRCGVEARERLKRYLEQRRELGERELVLDGMTVEYVMKIAGAAGAAPRGAGASEVERSEPPHATREEMEPGSAAPGDATVDWRAALRSSGADPSQAAKAERKAPPPEAPVSKRYEFPRPVDAVQEAAPTVQGAPSPPPRDAPPTADRSAATPAAPPPPGLIVGTAARDLFGSDAKPLSLDDITGTIRTCTRCRLYATATNAVPGEGDPNAELVCVGEAPGANEDATGRPFVGQAGQLLTKILAAINLRREDVFICNVLKHRPPGNRNPLPDEVAACSPYLVQQLEAIRPKVIVAFGTFAAQTLLNTKLPIGKLRGSVHRYYGIPLIVTYHPAALLRNPAWKRPTWEDVQLARRILDSAPRA